MKYQILCLCVLALWNIELVKCYSPLASFVPSFIKNRFASNNPPVPNAEKDFQDNYNKLFNQNNAQAQNSQQALAVVPANDGTVRSQVDNNVYFQKKPTQNPQPNYEPASNQRPISTPANNDQNIRQPNNEQTVLGLNNGQNFPNGFPNYGLTSNNQHINGQYDNNGQPNYGQSNSQTNNGQKFVPSKTQTANSQLSNGEYYTGPSSYDPPINGPSVGVAQNGKPYSDERVTFQEGVDTQQRVGFVSSPGAPPQSQYAGLPPAALPPALQEYSKMSLTMTNFGLNLLKNLGQPGNVVVSPYSIAVCLALLQQGARGDAEYQISRVIGMRADEAAYSYKRLTDTVKNRSSKNILQVATSIFTAMNAFQLNQNFSNVAKQNFDSEVNPINFERPAYTVSRINSWVAVKTKNFIKELLSTDSISAATQLVLANAVYFKGTWQTRFSSEMTQPMEFHLANGQRKLVPFMRQITDFQAGLDKYIGAQVVVMPFEGAQYSLMLILPEGGSSLDTVLSKIDEVRLLEYSKLESREVRMFLPRFTIRTDTQLRNVLQKMGLTRIFEARSDLSGIEATGTQTPKVSTAVHTAVLSIDEQGGTAAAATGFAAVALSGDDDTIYFKADRPFLAILWDSQQAVPLFMTKIEDPS
ncbi:unnamed protein product [Plutella xylostella]|uniref:(diamondback moth) hypothetical protein n=1 Tax=Plutella xylostella TaxID=51655 RepID=A0A8S4EA38_PLUXY|nr:unnamed protein product [Plutella xylostella]